MAETAKERDEWTNSRQTDGRTNNGRTYTAIFYTTILLIQCRLFLLTFFLSFSSPNKTRLYSRNGKVHTYGKGWWFWYEKMNPGDFVLCFSFGCYCCLCMMVSGLIKLKLIKPERNCKSNIYIIWYWILSLLLRNTLECVLLLLWEERKKGRKKQAAETRLNVTHIYPTTK